MEKHATFSMSTAETSPSTDKQAQMIRMRTQLVQQANFLHFVHPIQTNFDPHN